MISGQWHVRPHGHRPQVVHHTGSCGGGQSQAVGSQHAAGIRPVQLHRVGQPQIEWQKTAQRLRLEQPLHESAQPLAQHHADDQDKPGEDRRSRGQQPVKFGASQPHHRVSQPCCGCGQEGRHADQAVHQHRHGDLGGLLWFAARQVPSPRDVAADHVRGQAGEKQADQVVSEQAAVGDVHAQRAQQALPFEHVEADGGKVHSQGQQPGTRPDAGQDAAPVRTQDSGLGADVGDQAQADRDFYQCEEPILHRSAQIWPFVLRAVSHTT